MKNKRRNHSAQFKAKVALAAAKGDNISSGKQCLKFSHFGFTR